MPDLKPDKTQGNVLAGLQQTAGLWRRGQNRKVKSK